MVPLEAMGIRKLRRAHIPEARGKVLELGAGTGANLGLYDFSQLASLTLSDLEISSLLKKRGEKAGAFLMAADVENLPFEDNTFDTVVFTLLFCSVPDPLRGLQEVRRVLRPGGRIIFLEHVLGCSSLTKKVQHAVTPVWRKMAGNCHLNRPTAEYIQTAGFTLDKYRQEGGCVLIGGIASIKEDSH